MSKISIVVPVYYNSDTLELLYEDMKEKVLGKIGDYEIVFVDDGSGDNSWEIIQKIAAKDPNVVATKLSRNFGEHAAILAGLSVCTGDCAVTKQADLQEDSTLILDLYESWKRGNKVVLAIKVLEMMDEKNSSLTLQVMWIGFKTEKIYFHRKDREVGKSRWTLGKKIKLVVDSMMSFSYFPIRCMATLGSIFALFSLIGIILVIIEKIKFGTPMLGYASLMSVMLFGFGALFIMLSMLGEYIWRALEESRKRPPFIIDEVHRSDDKDKN